MPPSLPKKPFGLSAAAGAAAGAAVAAAGAASTAAAAVAAVLVMSVRGPGTGSGALAAAKAAALLAISRSASADWVFSPSSYVTRSFVEQGFPAERVLHLPYPVNLDHFSPEPVNDLPASPLRVICTGGVSACAVTGMR